MEEADTKAGKWNNGIPTPFLILYNEKLNEGHYTRKLSSETYSDLNEQYLPGLFYHWIQCRMLLSTKPVEPDFPTTNPCGM